MLETQRLQYLSVLGVDNYMPRRQLVGALPSAPIAAELLATAPAPQSLPMAVKLLPEAEVIQEAAVEAPLPLAALAEPEAQIESPVVPVSAATDTHSSVTPMAFVLSVWRIEDCLILDSRQPGVALPTDRLLQNILRALGYALVQLPPSETLRWPLFSRQHLVIDLQQEVGQAEAMVQAYISAQHQKQPLRKLLLMGAAATRFALASADDFESLVGKLLDKSPWENQVAVTPSLVDMLQEPLQKRLAWQALRELIGQ